MSTTSQNTLNSLISAASAYGDLQGNDAHVETLESLVIAAWAVMTDEQKAALLSSAVCSELLQQN
ncbi:hypothetical protein ACWAUP_004775 [Pseudomonas aeruginosa]